MKNLLFDLNATQPNASGKRHGGGKYGEIIFKRMISLGYRPFCYYSSSKWLNPEISKILKDFELKLLDVDSISLEKIVKENNITTLYSCLPQERELSFAGCNVVGTIHGLRGVETPYDNIFWQYKNNPFKSKVKFLIEKFFGYRKSDSYFKSIPNNKTFQFITVSNHSAAAFKSYYPQFRNYDIKVFYSPSTSSENPIETRRYTEPYFLMVSGNRWEKNNLRAIKALDNLFSNGYLSGYRAKITGVSDPSIYRYRIKNISRFDFLGYIDDNELEQLYHDAFSLIYPSLNEGFGYPPMEAMRYGVPVLASPYSSIPEVCQGAALYFNPQSVEEIMNRILLILDKERYQYYSDLAISQYKKITEKQKADLDSMIDWLYS